MSDYDVVVAGAGAAGLCAALAAAEAGASVLVAEAEDGPGGASRFAAGLIMAAGTSFQAERGIADDAAALFHEYMSFNQWNVEPAVARARRQRRAPVDWRPAPPSAPPRGCRAASADATRATDLVP